MNPFWTHLPQQYRRTTHLLAAPTQWKRIAWLSILILALAFTGVKVSIGQSQYQASDTPSADWNVTSAGGQISAAGGGYSLSGTFGQPAAGSDLTGGGYTLDGGFWAPGSPQQVYLPAILR